MEELKGNTVVFSDLHCGLAGNRASRLNICVKVVDEIVAACERGGVENVVFGGDWFHSRSMLDNNTVNVSIGLVKKLAEGRRVFMIVGNHDSYLKNSTEINSLNIFRDNPNVRVIEKPEEAVVNGMRCLFVPWLSDLSGYKAEQFDLMIGHFDISQKYLVQSYVEEHSKKTGANADAKAALNSDGLLSGGSGTGDLVGSFVDLVKRSGTVYAGHIHTRKEFRSKGRRFVFVGSPYQQTLGDVGCDCGFYALGADPRAGEFVKIESAPRHELVLMSEAVRPGYDFMRLAGQIVQKIYDVDVQRSEEVAVSQRISDAKPYEELVPEYRVAARRDDPGAEDSKFSVDAIRKSKLDYIRNYVDQMDGAALSADGIDREKLFMVLKSYYEQVVKE